VPAAVGAVHTYSGGMNDDKAREVAEELYKQLKKDGADITQEFVMEHYQYWGYNPPFTLPMFRRNEVWVELTQEQADSVVNSGGLN
jgi:hypothetical protein